MTAIDRQTALVAAAKGFRVEVIRGLYYVFMKGD